MGGKQSNWATGMGVNCIMANELTTPMEPSGRVLPLFRGEYSDSIVYENPDIVLYENSSYVAKQITIGNPPPKNVSSNDYWQMVAKGIIDADVSDSTIEFTEASERINIKSGEKSNIIMGKIMKFFTDLKDVAFSGSYVDLSNKPTIPASAKNGKLTIQKNGTEVQTFTANQSTNAVANILVPTISNSAAVTQTGQMALDAVEKNAAVPGTLANQISQANSNIGIHLKWIGICPNNNADNAISMGVYATNPTTESVGDWGILIVFTNGDANYDRWVFQFWLSTKGAINRRYNINSEGWTTWAEL